MVSCPQNLVTAQVHEEGERLLYVTHPIDNSNIYVKSGAIVPRPRFSKLMSVEGLSVVFKLLPEGTRVRVMGQELITDGGDTELEFEVAGEYPVELSLFPYMDETRLIRVGYGET